MCVGQRLAAIVLMLALIGLPGIGRADDDDDSDNARPAVTAPGRNQGVSGSGSSNKNDNKDDGKKGPDLKVEYLGWDPKAPELIRFKVTNVGDAASEKTTGKGETIAPPPAQETAPPIPALAPGATYQFRDRKLASAEVQLLPARERAVPERPAGPRAPDRRQVGHLRPDPQQAATARVHPARGARAQPARGGERRVMRLQG